MNKNILFIHTKLDIGGVETFFLRLNVEFYKKGISVNFLIINDEYNNEIFDKIMEKSEIIFLKKFLIFNRFFSRFFKIFSPLDRKCIIETYKNIDVIHVGNARQYFLAKRIALILKKPVKIIFGIYHSNEISWNIGGKVPFYEKFFRKDLFSSGASIYFPNDFSKNITLQNNIPYCNQAKNFMFPIGVVNNVVFSKSRKNSNECLRVCSVGRLVNFKTYNIHMINSIHELNKIGINVSYDIYGDGPCAINIESLISTKKINNVYLKGSFNYEDFNKIVGEYDCFVGSGTSLLQAASLGVPCIIGIENENEAKTYGLFTEIDGIDYHEQDLMFQRKNFIDVLKCLYYLDNEKYFEISKKHNEKSMKFAMDKCADSFLKMVCETSISKFNKSNYIKFILMFIFESILLKIFCRFNYSDKYKLKLKLYK
ncbi:hypothetical protein INP81_21220 [Comamonas thiooxydans]|uniref:hypothetical protein n=1 Tax=Comamonas thiooxydans TaxID=363952 RepID=UPI0018A3BF5D|nr:hypothetical protein [Comamonas thiooxydans]QOQ81811.1 hypothetical protein INP81_21220 [Comamonas thiooxydans]